MRSRLRRKYADDVSRISRMLRKGIDLIKPYVKKLGRVGLKILLIGSELAKFFSIKHGLESAVKLFIVKRKLSDYKMFLGRVDERIRNNLDSMNMFANVHFGIKILKAAAAFGIADIASILSRKALKSNALKE